MFQLKQYRWRRGFGDDGDIRRLISAVGQINARWRFGCPRDAGKDDIRLFPILRIDAVVMGNGELDSIDAGKIGRVHRVLSARAGLCLLPKHIRHGVTHRIKRGNRWQTHRTAPCFQLAPRVTIDQCEQDKAGVRRNVA